MPHRCYALLIGMGREAVSELPGNHVLGPLPGSVADVQAMSAYLQRRFGEALELVQWLAPPQQDEGGEAPTLARMRSSFDRLGDRAGPGDQILVLFVGHGVRLPTRRPDLKGTDGVDECLVLADEPMGLSGSWDDFVLRDVEIADVVRSWVGVGALVTWIIDCCHSGGASKQISTDVADPDSSSSPALSSRGLTCRSAWLPEMTEGCVLLASCQPHQLAYQLWIPELRAYRGCLTYHLLELLKSPEIETADWTWQRVHRHLVAAVHRRLAHQTPRLEGDITRRALGFGQGVEVDPDDPLPELQPPKLRWHGSELPQALEQSVADLLAGETLLEHGLEVASDLTIGPVGNGILALRSGAKVLIEEPSLRWEAEEIARALVHMARFFKVRDLENPISELSGHWVLRLEPMQGTKATEPTGPLEAYVLKIKNVGARVLYLTLLDLQPGWAIEQAYPTDGLSVPLEPARCEEIRVEVDPSKERRPKEEVLMALATTEEMDFHAFELAPWRSSAASRELDRSGFDELHELLMASASRCQGARGPWDWAVEKLIFQAMVLVLAFAGSPASSAEPKSTGPSALCAEVPFEEGEMARFVVRFGLFKAGEGIACLSREPAPDPEVELTSVPSGELWHLAGRGRASKLVSVFYKVDDLIRVWMESGTLQPHRQELVVRETNERAIRRVLFDHPAGQTHFYRNRTFRRGREPSLRDRYDRLAPGSFEPVSLLFHLRCRGGAPGDVLRIPLHENGKNKEIEIQVEKIEVIDTPVGEIEALAARIHLYFEGKLSNKQAFRVWVSNDERRIPLRFVADFTFAKLKGTLAGYRASHEAEVMGDLIGPLFDSGEAGAEAEGRTFEQLTGRALWHALCPLPDEGSGPGLESLATNLKAASQHQPLVP